MSKNNLKAAVAFLAMFILGMAAGYMITMATAGMSESDTATEQAELTPDQQDKESERRIQKMRRHMTQHLNLEEDQAEPLFALIRDSREERRAIMHKSRERMEADIEELTTEFHEQLTHILTESQVATWDSLYSRPPQQHHHRGGRNR